MLPNSMSTQFTLRFPVALVLVLGLLCGCAPRELSPTDQAKVQVKMYFDTYMSIYKTVNEALASPEVPKKTKRFIKENINPELNALKIVLKNYAEAVKEVQSGGSEKVWQAALFKAEIDKILIRLLPLIEKIQEDL